ncbi:MAG: DUF4390 domain-containing protein [Proteobacteria bacterium]|nr:DUF4390 domain-containing protein [Pseudomonadota bacterium]MBU1736649.1 DUF4390 domain-containing protein [Pseudomonadota bacterium]
MKIYKYLTYPFVFFVTLALFAGELCAAGEARIKDVVVSNSSSDLLLYLEIDNAFRPDMEEGLLNGIPATFTFYVNLKEVRAGRTSEELVSLSFEHTLSYDTLKQQFVLEYSETGSSAVISDLSEAKTLMAGVNGLKVIPLAQLKRGGQYFLEVKARLQRKSLPFFIHYLVPFWSLRDYETDWHYVEFRN